MENQLYVIVAQKDGSSKKYKVATFDTRTDAEVYISNAKLLKRTRGRLNPGMIFRPDSLLSRFAEAWVEEYSRPLPHNPYIEELR